MKAKPKFNPVITRVKLNPEQAVLACSCYTKGRASSGMPYQRLGNVCYRNVRRTRYCASTSSSSVS